MGELLPYLVAAGVLAAVAGLLAWPAAVVRRRGIAGAAVRGAPAAHDEALHVTAHESAYEIQAQAERTSPVVSPGGGPGGCGGSGRRTYVPRPRAPRRSWRFRKGGRRRR